MKARRPRTDARTSDPIEHTVVLMLENRSFDHMLGSLPGVDGAAAGRFNLDRTDAGRRYEQRKTSTRAIGPDPPHDLREVSRQIYGDPDGPCRGFVTEFAAAHPRSTRRQRADVMGFYENGFLLVLHRLARAFTVCDRWFSSVPGPTWTNRFFLLSGTSQGRVEMPYFPFRPRLHPYDQTTLFDRLNERRVGWRVFYGDIPQSLVLTHQRRIQNAARYRSMDRFYELACGPARDFPAFSLVEPSYFGADQNDDHPPSDVMAAQALLATVYNALRGNAELWATTLLVILYDEHGGLYDHVEPPAAVPPDGHLEEFTFDRYGVRVPAVLVSPWVPASVVSTELDHTSLLRWLTDKYRLGSLGRRTARANSFGEALRRMQAPRTDTPERIPVPRYRRLAGAPGAGGSRGQPGRKAADARGARRGPARLELNEHQRALLAFTASLEADIDEPLTRKGARAQRAAVGAAGSIEAARERVERFLAQQRHRASPPGRSRRPTR